jgi:hypothetical protein
MKFILYYPLFALFVFITATVAAFNYLVWWQAVIGSLFTFVALIWVGKLYLRYRFNRMGSMFESMFKVKSQVLRGATIELHSVTQAAQPSRPALPPGESEEEEPEDDEPWPDEDEEEAEDVAVPSRWYCIDVSIKPLAGRGPMHHWDTDDLRLVDARARVPEGLEDDDTDDIDSLELQELEVQENGKFVMLEQPKLEGPQRLRFLVGVPEGVNALKFNYYFEDFGHIPLPVHGAIEHRQQK